MHQILEVFFNVAILERAWPFLWRGVQMTILLSLVVVPVGVASGLAVAMLYHLHRKWLSRLLVAWSDNLSRTHTGISGKVGGSTPVRHRGTQPSSGQRHSGAF